MTAVKDDDMLGRTCLVTGATGGIGKEIARGLALKRAHVLVAARELERGKRVAEELSDDTANPSVEAVQVDVSSQAGLRAFAADFTKRFDKLHVLVNDAGVTDVTRKTTAEGIELVWATNVLGYFLTMTLFEPLLGASAPSRVVNVASVEARGLDVEDVELKRRGYSARLAYAQSKQADRMLTWAFARRTRGSGVTANAMHPGFVHSRLVRGGFAGAAWSAASALFGRSPERGAETAVWLASARALADDTSGFYIDKKERRCRFSNEEEEEKLWAVCERMTLQR
jgi:NAD(P)-dependent dehydrogenase (short-subunit alcohol dehydrogenase family)